MAQARKRAEQEGAGDEEQANKAAASELRDMIDQADPEPEDDSEEFEIGVEPQEPERSRDDKKRERGRLRERNDELERQNVEYAQRLARLEGMAQMLPSQLQALQQQRAYAQQQPAQDPIDSELEALYDHQERLYEAASAMQRAGQLSPEKQRDLQRQSRKLDMQKNELLVRKATRGQQPARPHDPLEGARVMMQMEFSDVYGNAAALQYAEGEFYRMRAKGAPDDLGSVKAAMELARNEFGLRGRRSTPVSEATRERYTSRSKGASSSGAAERRTMSLSSAQKSMATSMFPGLSEREACQKWVNEVGKDLVRQPQRNRR
jgi:hypothetical protein